MDAVPAQEHETLPQHPVVGSFAQALLPDDALAGEAGFSLSLLAMPTLPGEGRQTLISRRGAGDDAGWALFIDEQGRPGFWLGGTAGGRCLMLQQPLLRGCWYQLALVLATSGGRHPDSMLEARENYGMTLSAPGRAGNARVRAGLMLVPTQGRGGVFSTGFIAFAGALAHDAGAARVLGNVIDRLVGDLPLLDAD